MRVDVSNILFEKKTAGNLTLRDLLATRILSSIHNIDIYISRYPYGDNEVIKNFRIDKEWKYPTHIFKKLEPYLDNYILRIEPHFTKLVKKRYTGVNGTEISGFYRPHGEYKLLGFKLVLNENKREDE